MTTAGRVFWTLPFVHLVGPWAASVDEVPEARGCARESCRAAEVGGRRVVMGGLRTIHLQSGDGALHDARRDWEEALGQPNSPVFGWLSMEGILACGKEAFFTRVLSREQARSSPGPNGFRVTVTGCQKTD